MLARPAFLLGYAGLLPALAAAATAWAGPPEWREFAFRLGALYGGLILSFLGGAWWGLATRAPGGERAWPLYLVAVLPSLAALALLLVMTPPRLLILAGLIVLTLPVDRLLVAHGLAPANWMRLRIPLSMGLGLATLALGAAAL